MEQSFAALAQLAVDLPAPQVDMDDLRLDPDAFEVEDDACTLLGRRDSGGQIAWIARDSAGAQREVDEKFARYCLPRMNGKPVMRVFLSSTFRDMAVERTHLIRTVFPRLKRLAQQHGITLQEIDLRWGVTTEQVERGETVAICLDEIDRCRDYPPFFIGMLGERYGWIPDGDALDALDRHARYRGSDGANVEIRRRAREDGLSLTEMEIRYGVLDQPPARRHAFFYTRSRELTELLSGQGGGPGDYFDPGHESKQRRLKDALRADGLVRIDGYRSVLELGEDIERMLGAAVLRLARGVNAVATQYQHAVPDSLASNRAIDRAIAAERIALERDAQLEWDESYRWVCGAELAPRLLLIGPPGSGKRSCAQGQNLALEPVTLHCRNAHFNDTESAARYLRSVLRGFGVVPAWSGLARTGFAEALQAATARTLICVTDIDLLADGRDLLAMFGLVQNRNLCIILTASDPSYAAAAGGFAVRELGELGPADRHTFIRVYLEGYRKVLAHDEAGKVAALPLSGSPSFLRLLLDELRRGATFETLPQLIDTYAQFETLEDAYVHALDTWLRYVDADGAAAQAWQVALESLCLSAHGVPEEFFTSEDGARLPPLAWAAWLGLAAPILVAVERGWQLRTPLAGQAIERRYGARDGLENSRRRLCAFLLAAEGRRTPVAAAEITSQLMVLANGAAPDVRRLHEWMLAPDTARALGAHDPVLFGQAWRQLLTHGCSAEALTRGELTHEEAAALVPLFIELADWPALEALARRALGDAPVELHGGFAQQLALALWQQGRVAQAVELITPSLRAWMAAPHEAPPETMGVLMGMVADGELAFAPWEQVLRAGLDALGRKAPGESSTRTTALLMSALPFAATLNEPRLVLPIARQCILTSYELGGAAGLTLRLMAVAEAAQAWYMLGQFAEAVEIVTEIAGIGQHGVQQTLLHGRCARALGSALMELHRWEEAQQAFAYAWEFEVPAVDDAALAIGTSAMMAICLIEQRNAEASGHWLALFAGRAVDAPMVAREMLVWVGASLDRAGRQNELAALEHVLTALPPT
ncbi:MAG: DUF4062 domain-containing protein [Pseudomonadota bacterium]